MSFVHLHVHSEHSLLDGMIRIRDLPSALHRLGQRAIAITDHGNLDAMWKAQQVLDRADDGPLQLIPGLETYLAVGDRHDRHESIAIPADDTSGSEGGDESAGRGATRARHHEHLTLLATDATGWSNLLALQNAAEWSKRGGKPRIDRALLAEHTDGLLILTGCLGGPVLGPLSRGWRAWQLAGERATAVLADLGERTRREAQEHAQALRAAGDVQLHAEWTRAASNLDELIAIAGPTNVYVEIMEHGIDVETAVVPYAVELARSRGVRIVATNDAHYTNADDADAHAAWLAHQSASTVANPTYHFHGTGYHLASEQEMLAKRPEPWWREACAETARIADRVAPRVLPTPRLRLRRFPTPDGYTTSRDYFIDQVRRGAAGRFGTPLPDQVRQRLNEEAQVVFGMGMEDYFLIVADMIDWARDQGILRGAGRGSAAGSMLSYCLGIVEVDPLEHGLLFERFLEPGRIGMPDIDTDFEAARRDEVFAYLADRYGHDHVARIGSFGLERSRKALRDAARVLGHPKRVGERLSTEVPIVGGKPMRIADLRNPEQLEAAPFRAAMTALGAAGAQAVELAARFEDVVATVGVHACGFLIADEPIGQLLPLRVDAPKDGPASIYTAWDGADVEALGLCKLDILGLSNLDTAKQALTYINERPEWSESPVVFDQLPHPDATVERAAAAWRAVREGRTEGVFQLESSGMTELARDLRPESWDDASAILALYRPGPMSAGMHHAYVRRKHGQEPVSYDRFTTDPGEQRWIAGVLGSTYGIWAYQEQVMRLAAVVAGFDASERSKLRKAIGKKQAALMAEIGDDFIARAGVEYRDPDGQVMSPAFQRATAERLWEAMKGSAEYLFNKSHSVAYAKTTFATAYLKANWPAEFGAGLLATITKDERRLRAMTSLRREGIAILPPDVGRSDALTRPEGSSAVRLGLAEVKGVGRDDVAALLEHRRALGRPFEGLHEVISTGINAGSLDALIEAGACDSFGPRLGLLSIVRSVGSAPEEVPDVEWSTLERAQRQRQRILTASGDHPLRVHAAMIAAWTPPDVIDEHQFRASLRRVGDLPAHGGASVHLIGILAQWSERAYSRGKLVEIALEGDDGELQHGTMWNDDWLAQSERGIPDVGQIVLARGRVRTRQVEIEDAVTGELTVTTRTELTVLGLRVVPVADDGRYELTAPGAAPPRIEFPSAPLAPTRASSS